MNKYLQQAKSLMLQTIKGATTLTLLFCFIFVLFDLLLLMATHPQNHSITDLPIFLVYIFIPISILVSIDGVLIGIFLAWLRKKLSNHTAIILGLIIGTALAIVSNYVAWLKSATTLREVFFPEFWDFIIFPVSVFFWYAFFANIFFLPIAFSIIVSAYLGWRMNKLYVQDVTEPIKE